MSEEFELWTWSLTVYRRKGVPARCLALQDRYGFDVNVALACTWAATRGWQLEAADLQEMLESTDVARRRVLEIRPIRKDTKSDPDAEGFYAKLKAAELAGEKVVQRGLWRWLEDNARPAEVAPRIRAEQSLQRYAEHLDRWPAAAAAVQSFLDAVLEGASRDEGGEV